MTKTRQKYLTQICWAAAMALMAFSSWLFAGIVLPVENSFITLGTLILMAQFGVFALIRIKLGQELTRICMLGAAAGLVGPWLFHPVPGLAWAIIAAIIAYGVGCVVAYNIQGAVLDQDTARVVSWSMVGTITVHTVIILLLTRFNQFSSFTVAVWSRYGILVLETVLVTPLIMVAENIWDRYNPIDVGREELVWWERRKKGSNTIKLG